jgi:hypothetical protein
MSMPMRTRDAAPAEPMRDVLTALGLDPRKPETQALVLIARHYDLDPLLHEVDLIGTRNGFKTYVTRDGMLKVAHRSGQLDGIVVDELREGDSGWACTVSVYRKDCAHPFTYSAGCGKQEPVAKQGNGPEMALARAERRALKRAFAISSSDVDEPAEQITVERVESSSSVESNSPLATAELDPEREPAARDVARALDRDVASLQGIAHAAIGELTDTEKKAFLDRHQIGSFGEVWPAEAVEDALGQPF